MANIQLVDMTAGAIPVFRAQHRAALQKQLEEAKRELSCAADDLDAAQFRHAFASAAVKAAEVALEEDTAAWDRRPEAKA